MEQNRRETFFTKEKGFYTTLFRMMLVLALQNLVAYSINMADNVMLGNYDQNALSGAATVNQVFFYGTAVCLINRQCTGCTGLPVLG